LPVGARRFASSMGVNAMFRSKKHQPVEPIQPAIGVDETIAYFAQNLDVLSPAAEPWRLEVVALLQASLISEEVKRAFSQAVKGDLTSQRYRGMLLLCLCVLEQWLTDLAVSKVDGIHDDQLKSKLSDWMEQNNEIVGRLRFDPLVKDLMETPDQFLAHNRIFINAGSVTTSQLTMCQFSWHWNFNAFRIEPYDLTAIKFRALRTGFWIAPQKYADISGNRGGIQGTSVTGNLVLTTQLTGCCMIYSVNGPNLTVAHIWPAGAVEGDDLTDLLGGDGDLSNPVAGGTLGLFGKVPGRNETGLRQLGNRNVRTHGYCTADGHAYFIGVKVGGSWQIFGQQCVLTSKGHGVSRIQQLYP
jgi:hypothetical protein